MLPLPEAFQVLCLPGSMSVRIMKQYYTDKGILLEDLHLSDFTCKGLVDPRNPNVWVFNVTTLSSCSTIHKVTTVSMEGKRINIYNHTVGNRRVARNSQWGGLFWGFGGEAPSRRRLGVLFFKFCILHLKNNTPKNFAFFCKNNFILGLF